MDSPVKTFFQQPLQLGALAMPNRAILSPLAGVSDIPFRRICHELHAGLAYVEMLSAPGVLHGNRKTHDIVQRHPAEPRCGVQITGPSPESIATAGKMLLDRGFDTIDINMGCPVRKIVKKGWGSAILKEPERVGATMAALREAVDIPATAKIRLGYTPDSINVEEICTILAQAGAAMITIHGRVRSDRYNQPVQYEQIKRGVDAARKVNPRIITVGNGNIFDYTTSIMMQSKTGCDAVLVSRGALGNPWVFSQIIDGHTVHPLVDEWLEVVLRHLDYHVEFYGSELHATVMFRKHLLWYASGFPNARKMRPRLSIVKEIPEIRSILRSYAEQLPKNLRRFDNLNESHLRVQQAEHDPKYEMDRDLDRGVDKEVI